MIIHTGQISRKKEKEKLHEIMRKKRILFMFTFILLPVFIYIPFATNWISGNPKTKADLLSAVAYVENGTAFLVSPSHLITARHVISHLKEDDVVTLEFAKANQISSSLEAKLVFKPSDENKDYAVLQLLKPLNNMYYLRLGSADNAMINDQVLVIGYPRREFSSSLGSITNNEFNSDSRYLQLWAGAWAGNSGGPVILKESNEVVGILIGGFEEEFKGITIAIKIDELLNDQEFRSKKIRF